MAQWMLKSNGQVVPRQTIRSLQVAEIHSKTKKAKRKMFDALVKGRHSSGLLGDAAPGTQRKLEEDPEEFDPYCNNDEIARVVTP